MDDLNYFHSQSEIKISVLKIGTSKLTKSLVDQIREDDIFNDNLDFIGEKIFGFVKWTYKNNDKGIDRLIIAQKDGKLVKSSWRKILSLHQLKTSKSWPYLRDNYAKAFEIIFTKEEIDNFENNYKKLHDYLATLDEFMDDNDIQRIIRFRDKASAIIEKLDDYQIYI